MKFSKALSRVTGVLCWILIFAMVAFVRAFGQRIESQPNVAEQYLQIAADQERAALHLKPLRYDAALARAARAHALQMVSHGVISRQFVDEPDLAARGAAAGARFSLISENVAVSSGVPLIHSAWMHSEGHRHNLLDSNVDSVGIAVISRGHRLFAVEDFERSIPALTLQQQEITVAKALETDGIAIGDSNASARQVCADDTANDKQAGFVMRYTTSRLEQLPEALRSRLQTGTYRNATVAACAEKSRSDFSLYRIAVLLYR